MILKVNKTSWTQRKNDWMAETLIEDVSYVCTVQEINVITEYTRKLCYREDNRAMRPIYECLSCLFKESG